MTRRLIGWFLLFTVTLLATPLTVTAEDEPTGSSRFGNVFSYLKPNPEPLLGDRLNLKLGYKVWVAKWQTPQTVQSAVGTQVTSDHPTAMHGPSLTGRYTLSSGEWFNGVTFSVTSLRDGFDFQERPAISTPPTNDLANRRDTIVTAGLNIWENVGIFGGYYFSDQQFTVLGINALSGGPVRHRRNIQGPLFGIYGSSAISDRVSLYGNAAYAILNLRAGFDNQPTVAGESISTRSAQGYATEFGFNVVGPRIWKATFEFQGGFRAQIIQKTFGRDPVAGRTGGAILNDITWGPTIAINAVF